MDFLKHVLGLEELPTYEAVVKKAFDAFVLEHNYNADQPRLLRVVQNVFLQRRRLEIGDLDEEPSTNFGVKAPDKLFSERDLTELASLVQQLVR